jgi:hypothetical protein
LPKFLYARACLLGKNSSRLLSGDTKYHQSPQIGLYLVSLYVAVIILLLLAGRDGPGDSWLYFSRLCQAVSAFLAFGGLTSPSPSRTTTPS